ncbi:MAG: 3-isopropylmalate dehydratase large subunit [Candidatus Cloacimonetes bacterium]|nr:3-isopropylmalate dehydratase large subunit [Candidatus Cloacimonadota bacterium]
MNIIEKILSSHAGYARLSPGDIIDVVIDVRIARDFGGANVVKNIEDNGLNIANPELTFFTFDCNPTGSDQKYAANQQKCRLFARDRGIQVYDINTGIGTHLAIENGWAVPGTTLVSTDSHANILGAICSFGQGMGDRDIAAAWSTGKVWFKVPPSVKITLRGERPGDISAKDIALNLLAEFGANRLLGYAVEIYGEETEKFTLDERITISSMATEMGAIIILFPPSHDIMTYCKTRSRKELEKIEADPDAVYEHKFELDISRFRQLVAKPGNPEDTIPVEEVWQKKIDSAFIGSCTNGRIEDMRTTARILRDRKVAPGVVLKIVPATDEVWNKCLNQGIIKIFKEAGVLVGNAGCAGCAAGQIGQNGPGEVTISTGNRNFTGKQGKGEVYLASPAIVAASALAGYITTEDKIPAEPATFTMKQTAKPVEKKSTAFITEEEKPLAVEGRVWLIKQDNIDTDMIFHNRYLTITDINEMGQYALDNLPGWEDFSRKALPGDIIVTGKNFGAGSSRQQAVDCFKSLGIQCILAESFGAIYERNAINAGFPVLTYKDISNLYLNNGEMVRIDFLHGKLIKLPDNKTADISRFSDVQLSIYKKGDLLRK